MVLLGVLLFTACNKQTSQKDFESEIELEIMKRGADYLEMGDYDQAKMVYSKFIVKFPDHPYVDDADYRLAYICVIADDNNPYFDYKNAVILFQNFIENYPNSRYIIASKNWLNLLKNVTMSIDEQASTSANDRSDSLEINQLRIELKRVQAENSKLKKTLEELQKAIER